MLVRSQILNYSGDIIVAKGNALGIVIKVKDRVNPQLSMLKIYNIYMIFNIKVQRLPKARNLYS